MKPTRYDYIDALRGYAILLVMAVHVSQSAPGITGIGRLILDQGARGVQLFFVVSALTLLLSWQARHDGLLPFYIRRVFRIAPMFWLAIAFFLWLEGFGPRFFDPDGIGAGDVLLTVLVLHAWAPGTIMSIVPGGWSIGVEMMFYVVFPFLLLAIRGWIIALLGLAVAVVLSRLLYGKLFALREKLWPGLSDAAVDVLLNLWLPNQITVFLAGFLLYFAIRDYSGRLPPRLLDALLVASILAGIAIAIHPEAVLVLRLNIYTAYGIAFAVFAYCLSQGAMRGMVNRPIRYLGNISYSAYLLHFVVLGAATHLDALGINPQRLMDDDRGYLFFVQYFAYVLLATVILSTFTYRCVELPAIRLGTHLVERWKAARGRRASAARPGRVED